MQFNHNGQELDAPAKTPPIELVDARAAFEQVLKSAGCWPRDRVTQRTVKEVNTETGNWGRDAPLQPDDRWFLRSLNATPASKDSDEDGIPDRWETSHGLNPGDPDDASHFVQRGESAGDRHLGYTFVEYYINERADQLLP